MNRIKKTARYFRAFITLMSTTIYEVDWTVNAKAGRSVVKAQSKQEAESRLAGALASNLNMSSPRAVRKVAKFEPVKMSWLRKIRLYMTGR